MKLALIKIGGSLVTNKTKPFTAKRAYIRRFASAFADLRQNLPDWNIVLGNGAGSFAHFTAHQYGLRDGAHTPEQRYGATLTHAGVARLNTLIVDTLLHEQVSAFSLAPSSMLTYNNGMAVTAHLEPLKLTLSSNCVPVVYGDGVLDRTRGVTIVSTEQMLLTILEALRPDYQQATVIYMTGANGVLDEQGRTIPTLHAGMEVPILESLRHDTTGGIAGKVAMARRTAGIANSVHIIGANPADLMAVLQGEPTGTHVLPD